MTPIDQQPDRAVRLTFSYDGAQVILLSQQTIEMTISHSDPILDPQIHAGCWCDLHDQNGQILFRQLLTEAIRTDIEAPSDEPGYPLTRRPLAQPQGIFVALVPDLPEAQEVSIWNSTPIDQVAPALALDVSVGAATREIARFQLLNTEGGHE